MNVRHARCPGLPWVVVLLFDQPQWFNLLQFGFWLARLTPGQGSRKDSANSYRVLSSIFLLKSISVFNTLLRNYSERLENTCKLL